MKEQVTRRDEEGIPTVETAELISEEGRKGTKRGIEAEPTFQEGSELADLDQQHSPMEETRGDEEGRPEDEEAEESTADVVVVMDDLNQRKSSEQEQINRAYEEDNCEDEKAKHLSEEDTEEEGLEDLSQSSKQVGGKNSQRRETIGGEDKEY